MCRSQRRMAMIHSAWAGTAHMRENFMRPRVHRENRQRLGRMKFYDYFR